MYFHTDKLMFIHVTDKKTQQQQQKNEDKISIP